MKKKKNHSSKELDDREDRLSFHGIVEDVMGGTLFKIRVSEAHMVLATLAGKLRQNNIQILLEDRVKVEVSPYDLSRGRIVWRASSGFVS